jgi:hypothetical protein
MAMESKVITRTAWALALAHLLAAAALIAAGNAHGYIGTFNPNREYAGLQLATFVDSNAAPLRCLGLAAEKGDVGSVVIGMVAPMTACTYQGYNECTIIAPISPGAGQVLAAVTALAGPDALLGHEFRHC